MAKCEECGGKKKINCDTCDGSGSTQGNHMENCDLDECKICDSDEECGECFGAGTVECEECK